mmetsp:Transcript_9955/g.23017  ORF Transcript_9955/g.23017 Transcript_9955/m.23017 type:complete len:248 (-) Transcript_9955:621-1364(-)
MGEGELSDGLWEQVGAWRSKRAKLCRQGRDYGGEKVLCSGASEAVTPHRCRVGSASLLAASSSAGHHNEGGDVAERLQLLAHLLLQHRARHARLLLREHAPLLPTGCSLPEATARGSSRTAPGAGRRKLEHQPQAEPSRARCTLLLLQCGCGCGCRGLRARRAQLRLDVLDGRLGSRSRLAFAAYLCAQLGHRLLQLRHTLELRLELLLACRMRCALGLESSDRPFVRCAFGGKRAAHGLTLLFSRT